MRIKCSNCGKPVSPEIPVDDIIIRAYIQCPECCELKREIPNGIKLEKNDSIAIYTDKHELYILYEKGMLTISNEGAEIEKLENETTISHIPTPGMVVQVTSKGFTQYGE